MRTYNPMGSYSFNSNQGGIFYRLKRWGGKIPSDDFIICKIARKTIRRQKYQIRTFMIDLNDQNI